MALVTYSVVRRHMKQTSGFTLSDGSNPPPVTLDLGEGESLIGWYRNPPPWEGSLLVFTSNAIWTVERGVTERVRLADIVGYESPGDERGSDRPASPNTRRFRFMRVAGSFGPFGKYKDFICRRRPT